MSGEYMAAKLLPGRRSAAGSSPAFLTRSVPGTTENPSAVRGFSSPSGLWGYLAETKLTDVDVFVLVFTGTVAAGGLIAFTLPAVFVASIVISHAQPVIPGFTFGFFRHLVVIRRHVSFAFCFGGFGGFLEESLGQPEGFAQRRFGSWADGFGL